MLSTIVIEACIFTPQPMSLSLMFKRQLRVITTLTVLFMLMSCSPQESSNEKWASPAGDNSVSPNLSLDMEGLPILSWMKVDEGLVALQYSRWTGTQWSDPITVASGEEWLVNRADFPSVVQLSQSLWAAHWLVMTDPSIFAYDVAISLSRDGGKTWTDSVAPHTDGTFSEHGFVSFFAEGDDIGAVWLDGREMTGGHGKTVAVEAVGSAINGMTLRSTKMAFDGSVYEDQIIDGLVCDCCQTDISATPTGPIAVFRNRTEDERRDIYFSRMVNGRWMKSKPVAVDDWEIAGCPVNGPSVAANRDKTAVAWYTQAKGFGEVKFALSDNGTDVFLTSINVDSGDGVLGQVGLAAAPEGGFIVSWMTFIEGTAGELRLRYIDNDGVAYAPIVGSKIDMTRKAGLPQMVLFQDKAVLSWTGGDGSNKTVQVAEMSIDLLQLASLQQ